jgi:hypothetical protein
MLAHRGSSRAVRDGMVLAISSSRAKNDLSQNKRISHATETPAPVDVRYHDLHGYGESCAAARGPRRGSSFYWYWGTGLSSTRRRGTRARGRGPTASGRLLCTGGGGPTFDGVWGSTSRGRRLLWPAASPLAPPSLPLAPLVSTG